MTSKIKRVMVGSAKETRQEVRQAKPTVSITSKCIRRSDCRWVSLILKNSVSFDQFVPAEFPSMIFSISF